MNRFKSSPTVFCPVCGTERELPVVRVRYAGVFLKSFGWAVLFGTPGVLFASWPLGLFLAILAGALGFIAFETWETVKVKRDLACPVCRFDPVLYRRAPEEAKQRCLESLKHREEMFLRNWQTLKRSAQF